jgi:GTP-binding protein HflX
VLINDTIGFIRDLPPDLISAFRSTLEDSIEADLLLHLIDASDPLLEDKINVVNAILDDIGAEQPRVLVFNKIDRLTKKDLSALKKTYGKTALYLSAVSGEGIEKLKERLVKVV